jgi:AraC-like DNA-binding protein
VALLIDTNAVPAQERAEFWAESMRSFFNPLRISAEEHRPFGAKMWVERLASIDVYRVAAGANTLSRTAGHIAAGDPDCVHLQILLRGRLQGAQQQRSVALKPGDMTAYDSAREAIVRADEPFDVLVLRLRKSTLGKQAANLCRLTSVRIPGDRGLPRLAARFFIEAASGLADGSIDRDDPGLEGHVIDLVRRLYFDLGTLPDAGRPRAAGELLLRAQAEIETRLGDPSLDPEQIAGACFVSTRYLHRVFETEGLTVCGFIRSARLERCRRDLLDPALRDEPIHEIASRWGLPSAPHFSRVFREAYACSPREFRRTGAVIALDSTPALTASTRAARRAESWAPAGWQ